MHAATAAKTAIAFAPVAHQGIDSIKAISTALYWAASCSGVAVTVEMNMSRPNKFQIRPAPEMSQCLIGVGDVATSFIRFPRCLALFAGMPE
jgi:hypothetical protein